ncbi:MULTISPECIES: NirA family protein [Bosea]|uniref:NirA family protein n=1 Tax=Bosea TaxID=85413 RepID=UPI00214FB844|nr:MULTISPECIES: NirA family protein [Bosea]MCR4523070.1 NirA family protein [Bosea sp. 47.2.35]MDR6829902.1 ferredoxin-nitrite reductase [Bosea robiniae]MDR6896784.1 ferredoxin-nitrite reductase [Bosea sp. BE109]MDR7140194.1 ferredoxin-nitrite reductase [Bosea sp. BE168]MDR7176891.1 ferredoxin-nitrite reductase [Bosea sp. BE271]
MSDDFTPDQKRYLEGFVSGMQSARTARGLGPLGGASGSAPAKPSGPDREHAEAQARTVADGGKLVDQEKWKAAEHPFDAYARFKEQAASGIYPKPEDNFRWRYHGLFYVAPAQNSYMCRLRIPNGILKAWQFAGVADLAEALGGGYSHVTTRANLQVREISAENGAAFLEGLADLGLTAKGSGADNIRNVTGSATAGIDPLELLDTRPHARAWHHHILNDRSLYGLPRKFNVAFDGAGSIATLEDTNDIGFQAIDVMEGALFEGQPVAPGIWYRLALGGITGHKDLARDTGVIVAHSDAIAVADAIVRVFVANGNRTDRNKSRLKYVLDAWGFDKFLTAVEEKLGRRLIRLDGAFVKPRPVYDRLAHIGIHAQVQAGLNWIGVALPVGKLTVQQMRVIASIANQCGDGDIRLTVWQNLLISGVPDAKVDDVLANLQAVGLSAETSVLRAGLIACTGATGCKFAGAHTKEDALAIAAYCEPRITLDTAVNIHLTGCHNSCAQHYIGDLGLIGAKVPVNDEGDTVPGYHVFVGGGFGVEGGMGREFRTNVKAEDTPALVEAILRSWQTHRAAPDESFVAFARRHEIAALQILVEQIGDAA